jgi:V/A-type H+-transporting ATPase subunit E
MDVKLENLIERIKQEGVEGAQKTSEEMLKKAQKEAEGIVKEAKKEAEKIIEDAKQQTDRMKKSSETDLKQAVRDSELLMRERFSALFDSVFKKEVSGTLKPGFLKEIILKIVDKWLKNPNIDIELSEEDKKELEKLLFTSIKKDLKKTITIHASSDVNKGFRIGQKGEDVYYDFSDETIASLLKKFLNPRLIEILDREDG